MTTIPHRINPRLGAAALRAPAASREDSRSQAILRFLRPSSLDYSARNRPPVITKSITLVRAQEGLRLRLRLKANA